MVPLKTKRLTLWILSALIFPVCLTWGPRHKSIKGPHLKYRTFVGAGFFKNTKHGNRLYLGKKNEKQKKQAKCVDPSHFQISCASTEAQKPVTNI